MTRLMRPPSVADYERMTQAARLAAAQLVTDRTRAIAAVRDAERRARAQRLEAGINGAAQAALDRIVPDPPDVTAARREVLADADPAPARYRRAAAARRGVPA